MINWLRWKREILFLIPSITGGGTSSLLFTNSNHRNGELSWKSQTKIDSFLKSVGINNSASFKPEDLLKEAGNYSTIVPALTKALSTQIAKQIFNGQLYKGTKYESGIGELYPKLLDAQKKKIELQISSLEKNKKRIKKSWAHDERKYLDGLRDYVLSRIDEKNIQEYFTTSPDSHLFRGKKIHNVSVSNKSKKSFSDSISPLLGFLMGVWIEKHRAGYYVHKIIPYSSRFSTKTKEFYNKKYKDIRLPDKPDYFFPDYEERAGESSENLFKKYIDEWLKGKKSYDNWYSLYPTDRSSEIKEWTKIAWISPTNNTHKNIALRYLAESPSDDSKTQKNGDKKYLVSLWKSIAPIFLRYKQTTHDCENANDGVQNNNTNGKMKSFSSFWGQLFYNPLSLFCINEMGKSQPDFMMFTPDEKTYKTEDLISSKIIFYRDEKGFNLLYPIKKAIIDNDQQGNESNHGKNAETPGKVEKLIKNSELVSNFKQYVEENFSFLLLKYHSFIRKECSKGNTCSCDEIIKKLIEFIELSHKLRDWNTIWKIYDIRKVNNSVLTASSSGKNNYLNKMGTADINPPEFLESRIRADLPKLQQLHETIQGYISKATQYLNGNQTLTTSNGGTLSFEKQSSKEGHNYWSINKELKSKRTDDVMCIRQSVLQYLLESIFTQKLINKFLKIPLIFESSRNLMQSESVATSSAAIQQASSESNSSPWDQKIFDNKWKEYFKNDSKEFKLSNLLLEKIRKEIILSRISDISDTTLHYLTNQTTNQDSSNDEFKGWKNIESFITLTNLDDENSQFNEQLKTFITAIYLMENSFSEYKENIRKIIKAEGFGVYAFTLSWNKFCEVDDFLLEPIQKVEVDSFWTPLNPERGKDSNNIKEWGKQLTDPRQCIKTTDRLSVSSLKKNLSNSTATKLLLNLLISIWESISTERNLKEETLMGYKGLISAENVKKLPADFYFKIFTFLYKEGHINWTDIETQIKNLKTNNQLIQYLEKIKNINPSIGKTFEFSDVRKKPENTDEAKSADAMDWFNLNKRKELVIQFIKENLLKTQPTEQKRFQGLWFEKEKSNLKNSYVFEKNENSSIAYLIQITTDDLKDDDSFLQFVTKYLTPESLIQDVVKQAQNKALQMKAINNFLSRGKWINDKKVFNLKSGDYFLKQQLSSIITV